MDQESNTKKGVLYVVATPIGNLEDITFRAVRILTEADVILAEDTRHTSLLLNHYNIKKEMISYRDQNHQRVIENLLFLLKSGKNLALVSDAGTPLISDPGYKLVQELVKNDIDVISIPGPSSVIASLAVSGLPTDKFLFIGFLPKGGNKRNSQLENYLTLDSTLILFESPYRVRNLVESLSEKYSKRQICIVNDITKFHEKILRGTPIEVVSQIPKDKKLKGEFTILIAKEDL